MSKPDDNGFECPTCGRDDFKRRSHMRIHHANSHGESISDFVEKQFVCGWCGDGFTREVRPGQEAAFCSQSCASKQTHADRGNSIGEAAKGAKQRARERDGHTCQRCGVDVSHRWCEGPDFEVHHIIPTSAGGPDSIENLVTLCHCCHVKIHEDMQRIHETHPGLLEKLRDAVCNDD